MLSKNKVKYINSLSAKKFRQQYHKFVAEGDKIVQEILQAASLKIELLVATESWLEANRPLIRLSPAQIESVTEAELKKVSSLTTPHQALIVADYLPTSIEENVVRNDWSLYLDGIQDPGNMGTILRTADWFGIQHVFCSKTCVDVYNPKVLQASMGAFLRVKVVELSFLDWKKQFPALPVYGTLLHGNSLHNVHFEKSGILVLGNEGNGISTDILPYLDKKITIPKHPQGGAESLNVGVATGILCAAIRSAVQ